MAVPDSWAKQWALLSPTPSPPAPPEASEAHWAALLSHQQAPRTGPCGAVLRALPTLALLHRMASLLSAGSAQVLLPRKPGPSSLGPLSPGARSTRYLRQLGPQGSSCAPLLSPTTSSPGPGKGACLLRAPPSPTGQVFAPRPTPALGSQTNENAKTWLSFPDPQAPHL